MISGLRFDLPVKSNLNTHKKVECKKTFLFLALALCLIFSGCASSQAMRQPNKKDLSVLEKGNERKLVIGELGAPVHTEKVEGKYVDTFSFVQGFSKGNKAARAAGHTLLSIGTFGIWEVAGQGIEGAASGSRVVLEVKYTDKNLVNDVRVLKGPD